MTLAGFQNTLDDFRNIADLPRLLNDPVRIAEALAGAPPGEPRQETLLRVIAEQVQAQTAILRLIAGPALTDAALARAGVTLPTALDPPIVRRARLYTAGEVLRLPRSTPRLTIYNLGSGGVRLRIYGVTLPAPGEAADATDPPPTDEITLGPGLALDWSEIISRGFQALDAGTLMVIAR